MAKQYARTRGMRVLNRLMGALVRLGVAPGSTTRLTVVGRSSGRPRTTPVFVFESDGSRWIVSPYGEREWVKNARVDPHAEIRRGRRGERIRLEEVDAATAAPVLLAYLKFASYPRPYFDVTTDSPLSEVEAEAPRHPVFRVHAA